MALPAHVIHAPAGLPVDEAMRPELVEFGTKNLYGANVRQVKRGCLGKRQGFDALSAVSVSGSDLAVGRKVLADRDTIVRIGDITAPPVASVYDPQSQRWNTLAGSPSECAVRLVDLPALGDSARIDDIAYANGYFAVTWRVTAVATNYALAAIVNATTGAVVSAPVQIGSGTSTVAISALLAVVGNYIVAVRLAAGNTINAWYLDTTSAATIASGWVAMTDLATDASGSSIMAVRSLPHASSARAAIAYVNTSAGASRVTVKTLTATGGVLETQTIDTNSVTPAVVDIGGDALDTLWVAWNEATLVRVRGLSPLAITATALATTATIITVVTSPPGAIHLHASATAGQGRLFVNDGATVMQSAMRGFQTSGGAAATNGSQITVYSAHAVGRAVVYNTRFYIPVIVNDTANTQKQITIVDWTADVGILRPVANPAPGLGSVDTVTPRTRQCSTIAGATGKYYLGMSVTKSSVANASALVEMDFLSARRWQTAAWGNSTYLTGGVAQYLDGLRVSEVGFLVRPRLPTTSVGGVGITCLTGWRYVCVYEAIDSDGNWHVSGLSTPSASTGAVTDDTVTVTTAPLTVSSRLSTTSAQAGGVRVAFYRTLDGAVAPYYRLGTTINDPTAATVTYADTTTDATLAANAKLYSQPGVSGTAQDKRPPPFLSCIASYNGMLVGASGSDVWYSGQSVSGEGAWFNPIFQMPVPGEGEITALWVMDGTLFVAKRREIYAISGEPPSDNGAAGGLGVPRRLSVDVGCIESRSVCTTALGTFFQSDRGIEILSRAQSVEWVGEAVQDTLASYPIVTSATVDPASCCVLIELAASESAGLVSGNGRTLVFDLSLKDWVSTDRRKSQAGVADTPSQSACMVYTGSAWRYAWLGTNGRVYTETSDDWTDADGTFVVSQYETAHLKHGLHQEQRVWAGTILFERNSACGLIIEHAYDYSTYSGSNDKTWTEAEVLAAPRQLEWRPLMRGQAMKFRLKDTAPATVGTGQGLTFVGTSFDAAPIQTATKGAPRLAVSGRK